MLDPGLLHCPKCKLLETYKNFYSKEYSSFNNYIIYSINWFLDQSAYSFVKFNIHFLNSWDLYVKYNCLDIDSIKPEKRNYAVALMSTYSDVDILVYYCYDLTHEQFTNMQLDIYDFKIEMITSKKAYSDELLFKRGMLLKI